MIHRREGPFAGTVLMILRPPPNDRIELQNQVSSGGLLLMLHEMADRLQKGMYVFLGWRA